MWCWAFKGGNDEPSFTEMSIGPHFPSYVSQDTYVSRYFAGH